MNETPVIDPKTISSIKGKGSIMNKSATNKTANNVNIPHQFCDCSDILFSPSSLYNY